MPSSHVPKDMLSNFNGHSFEHVTNTVHKSYIEVGWTDLPSYLLTLKIQEFQHSAQKFYQCPRRQP